MEENLILEGLLSMVTELKEKQEAQVTPASREETLERLNAIEQALSELHSNPAVSEKDLQAIRSQLNDIRNRMQGQQKHLSSLEKLKLRSISEPLNVYSPLEMDMPCISLVCPLYLNWIAIPISANRCCNCCQLRDLPISFFTAV